MKRNQKTDKELKRRYGAMAESMASYYEHLDLRPLSEMDDDAFAYIMQLVKGVKMLDLNETEISNESIKLLTRLEYVNELGVKGCRIDDSCVQDLNKITSLEVLHVKNTGVTIDGLLQLKDLFKLKKILFSADDVEAIKEKILQLKTVRPACDFVIDGRYYYCNSIDLFVYSITKQSCTYRLKIKGEPLDAAWSNWLSHPSETYIEAESQGPYSINDIEWIDINPVKKGVAGTIVPGKEIDHSPAIIELLEKLAFPYMVTDGIISVYLVNKEL